MCASACRTCCCSLNRQFSLKLECASSAHRSLSVFASCLRKYMTLT
jgi:hypothetical protein